MSFLVTPLLFTLSKTSLMITVVLPTSDAMAMKVACEIMPIKN